MLNQLFKQSAGFPWGVRASAFLSMGLLAISTCLMKVHPSVKKGQQIELDLKPVLVKVLKDFPFMLSVCRSVDAS